MVVLGPTATGKTKLAVKLADKLNGEVISADSRQVYRGMDIGTGKDLSDYKMKKKKIPGHLIDIADPVQEYSVFQFQTDFQKIFSDIKKRQKLPILCGGTGFYIKAVLMDFHLPAVAPDKKIRQKLENWAMEDLIFELESLAPDVPKTSLDTKRRVIRAIEVEMNRGKDANHKINRNLQLKIHKPIVLGIEYPRGVIREKITKRLHERFNQGMIEEVETLLDTGITHERLERFGLEYRFISRYLDGQLTREEMIEKLNTAIHQFAKRQMTFFRNIEKNGTKIHWIPEGNLKYALDLIRLK
tara:strand:- start:25 stop:924 length:900 start_codon:yes stop_codon:yes gene_type:complete